MLNLCVRKMRVACYTSTTFYVFISKNSWAWWKVRYIHKQCSDIFPGVEKCTNTSGRCALNTGNANTDSRVLTFAHTRICLERVQHNFRQFTRGINWHDTMLFIQWYHVAQAGIENRTYILTVPNIVIWVDVDFHSRICCPSRTRARFSLL